jgi:hypothetical protein
MLARATAILLVLVLVGPSVVTATCELTCALASHHREAVPATQASCHEHQGSSQGSGVSAKPSTVCHESADLPSAVIDAWLNSVAVLATSAATVVVAAPLITTSIVRAYDRHTVFDPRPAHRPLRV